MTVLSAALIVLPSAATALADIGSPGPDALGNTDNSGSGAAFTPQTNHDLVVGGGEAPSTLQTGSIEVAGVQVANDQPMTFSAVSDMSDLEIAQLGFARGQVLHGEGDLLLLSSSDAADTPVVVRLPAGSLSASDVPAGAVVAANGSSADGIFEAMRVTIWPGGYP